MATRSRISVVPFPKSKRCHKDVLFIEGVPASTKEAFKEMCRRHRKTKHRETMRDAIIKLMRFYVYNQGEIPQIPKQWMAPGDKIYRPREGKYK